MELCGFTGQSLQGQGELIGASVMGFTEHTLCPGASLYVIPKDTFLTDYLSVTFTLPLDASTASAYALLPSVLCRGCEAYPTQDALAVRLDTLYNAGLAGRCGKSGEAQLVVFRLHCLEQDAVPPEDENEGPLFSSLIETFCDVLFHPRTERGVFLSSYTEGEKKNLAEAIRAQSNNKAVLAMHRLEQIMFADEVFSVPARGTLESAAAVTPEALWQAYTDMLRHAPVSVTYVGRQMPEQVRAALSGFVSALGRYRSAEDTFRSPQTQVIRRARQPVREVCEHMDVRQSRLCIGYRSAAVLADRDFYKFALFCELLGGSASSLLFLEVRERMGLCYDCSAFPDGQKGTMFITCGISADRLEAAREAIRAQIDVIRHGKVPPEVLEAARKSLISAYREIEDSAAALGAWYENRRAAGIETSPEQTVEQVLGVTARDLARCADALTEDTVYFLCGTGTDMDLEEDEDDAFCCD